MKGSRERKERKMQTEHSVTRLLCSDDEDPPPIQSPSTSHMTSAKDTSESDPGANI